MRACLASQRIRQLTETSCQLAAEAARAAGGAGTGSHSRHSASPLRTREVALGCAIPSEGVAVRDEPVPPTAGRDDYEGLRPLMFSIAYRMLGSVGEAEDVVQTAHCLTNNLRERESLPHNSIYL
jgi:hypothetical protein